jgi:hypothetical protein
VARTDEATDESRATARAKAMFGMKWMSMTASMIDAVLVKVVSMLVVVAASVSGGCVLVGRWVGPHHFHCLTPSIAPGCLLYLFLLPIVILLYL